MQHTPYGYEIVDGKVIVDEEKAEQIRKICENYLGGCPSRQQRKMSGLP